MMNVNENTSEELKRRAKAGDLEAIQILRANGFFQKKKAAKEGYAVSHAQRRLWILDQMEDDSSAYNIPGAILLEGKLDTSAFQKALETVVNRHESLRTTFVDIGGCPRQIIHDKVDFHIDEIDISREVDGEKTALEYVLHDATAPFDLSKEPLLRAKLLKTEKDRHVFTYCIHHIVCDAWSMAVIVDELMALYKAYSKGLDDPLQSLKIQYKDYAAWQNRLLESNEAESHREYWHEKLAGKLQPLNLPTNYSRPEILTYNGDTLFLIMESSIKNGLNALGRKSGSSLFVILSAIVKILLYRYTGQEDIVVGSAVAGRDHPDLEDQIGFYVNTLALRDNLNGDDSFGDVLRKVKQTTEEAFEHEIYPFDRLVDEMDIDREMNRTPIFNVMVDLQDSRELKFLLGDIKISEFHTGFSVAKFDLTFFFEETVDGLNLGINYNTDIFSKETIQNMIGYTRQLMVSIIGTPDVLIKNLEILSQKEKQRLLIDLNDTSTDYPKDMCIQHLFEFQVESAPEEIAVVCAGQEFTYRELNVRANQLAHYLQSLGVGPEVIVGICVERSLELIVGLLGVLKAGGAYVPLDPTYPKERMAFMLQDTGMKVLLTQEKLASGFSSIANPQSSTINPSLICLDADREEISKWSKENPVVEMNSGNLAYVIYTSGTSGKPKGVMIEHRSVVNLSMWHKRAFNVSTHSRATMYASIGFDASIWEIFPYLLSGATLYPLDKYIRMEVKRLVIFLQEHSITHIFVPPIVCEEICRSHKGRLNTQITILTGGDVLKDVGEGDLRIVNNYGPTECTVVATSVVVSKETRRMVIPIGTPIDNTQIYILDDNRSLLPAGFSGEICIGGEGVGRGYLNGPKLTEEKFIPHPFETGKRIYRTGDLARYLPDGNIEFLGRIDQQVKIRGFRIELGEIEVVLSNHPNVREAVVVACEDKHSNKKLVAYIVFRKEDGGQGSESSGALSTSELRNYLGMDLPEYMIPASFVELDALPLTTNGKIDKQSLPVPENNVLENSSIYEPPRNETERKLAQIWSALLDHERVGIHDNFFELGGHSLKAAMMVSRVHKELNVKIGLREAFRSPTIEGLARAIQKEKPSAFARIEPIPNEEHYPVSNAQRRLWILEQMGAEKAAYNICGANLLEGDLDIESLGKALQTLIVRHESLRTTFFEKDEGPRQKIHKSIEFQLKVLDLTEESIPELKARELVLKEALLLFDLEQGPLFKAKLFRIAEKRYVFFFNMHHIISDGWSMEIIVKEMLVLYTTFVEGKENPLLPLRIQYRDFASWQNGLLSGAEVNAHQDYWHGNLSGDIPTLDIPSDYRRPAIQTFKGDAFQFSLDGSITDGLRKLGREYGASFFMVMLSLVKVLLYRYTGQEDIIVGSPIAGRDHADLEEQIGFYVNMLALRDEIKGQDSIECVLENVRETVTNAFDHQVYPFDRLVEELQIKRDMGRSPLFDVVVAMQNVNNNAPEINSIKISEFEFHSKISKFDLAFFFTESEEGDCVIGIEYSTDLFLSGRIERMAEHFQELAKSALSDTLMPVMDLNIMSEMERQKVLTIFNNTGRAYPRDKTIAEIFEDQVEKTPENPAVACMDTVLTYRELNNLANGLAKILRENHNLQPEECVGILMDSSEWTAVALLGILKAGGAYVPIDTNYPNKRMVYMLRETSCRILLSESKYVSTFLSDFKGVKVVDIKELVETDVLNPGSVGKGSSLAYVIFTSGSTGEPKGSLIEQKSVLRLVLNTNYINIAEDDRILQTGSLAFDASTFEIWGALLNGACICFTSEKSMLEVREMSRLVGQHGITIMWQTSSLFNQLVEADIKLFKGLRCLLVGGEKLSAYHINKVKDSYPQLKIINGYGPTENTTFTACCPIEKRYEKDIPLGKPISNTQVYILEKNESLAAIGIPGEICIGGDGLARGYLNDSVLTAMKFKVNSFFEGGRLYHTGDVGCWLPDGNIEFLGRIDNQVKVRGFRVELEEIENLLLSNVGVKEAVVITRTTTVGTNELIAYFSAHGELDITVLKSYLSERLPDFMIPSHIVQLERLPLTVNGKVDRQSLPMPEGINEGSNELYAAPCNELEELLVNTWQSVLNRERIGIHDNYFEMGGDSIRAIQVVSRLKRTGWILEIKDLFQKPTIAELSPRLGKAKLELYHQEIVSGHVPLTAIQQWFFEEHEGDLHHFNQSVLLRTKGRFDENALRLVFQKLHEHHDALRMCYKIIDGTVEQVNIGLDLPLSFEVVDLTGEENEITVLESHADSVQAGFTLEKGSLMKAVLYRLRAGDRLLLVIHHLIVDGVSWRIIIDDIEQGYRLALDGDEICFGAKTVSFKQWAEEVERYAACETFLQESTYWSSALEDTIATPLPEDFESEENLYGDCQSASISFSENETNSLLTGTHHAYYTEINDILLTALGRALKRWHGGDATWVTMEGHGREALEKPLDISRTVGWFTSMYPFLLKIEGDDPGHQIKQVKEALRQIPSKGVGFGILSHITPKCHEEINHDFSKNLVSNAQLSFNYLGQFDERGDSGFFEFADELSGQVISPRLQRHHDLDVGGMIVRGQLNMSILFNSKQHRPETVEKLLADFKEELLAVVEHCQKQPIGEKTPGDFTVPTLFSLEQYDVFLKANAWEASKIDDMYPLSPMQEGMLFESLYNEGSTAYFIQTSYRLNGTLQLEQFKQSWHELCRRHAVLRTAFVHENVSRPLQVVFKDRVPEIVVIDWRDFAENEQNARIETYLEQDIKRGFDFQRDALIRMAVLQLENTEYQVVWSYHHILFDGWCLGNLYKEFNAIYSAFLQNDKPQLSTLPPYSEYIGWLEKQNLESSKDFWSHYLSGYEQLATLPKSHKSASSKEYLPKEITFEIEKTVQLEQFAAQQSVTLNTVIQTLWGLLLSRYNNVEDVVFGAIVSGRPSALKGVEEMVGLFINAIPVRMKYQAEQPFLEVLQAMQKAALESGPYHYCSLVEVQAQSTMGRDLFDHMLVFENYPIYMELTRENESSSNVATTEVAVHDRTHYDFDVTIIPGNPLEIKFSFNGNVYLEDQIERTATHFQTALSHILQSPNQPIGSVQILPEWEQQQLIDTFNKTAKEYPYHQTLHQLFQKQVEATPNRTAAIHGNRQVSYAQLNEQANRVANWLRHAGINRNDFVGILEERGLDFLVAILGILKAGAAFLPIDPSYPNDRVQYMVTDSRIKTLITRQVFFENLFNDIQKNDYLQHILYFDNLDPDLLNTGDRYGCKIWVFEEIANEESTNPSHFNEPTDIAYMLYTSGSTGLPKGTMVRHNGAVNHVYAEFDELDFHQNTAFLQSAPSSSDISVWQFLGPLLIGGRTVIVDFETVCDPGQLFEVIKSQQVTLIELVPVVMQSLLDHIVQLSPEEQTLPALEWAMVTGEAVSVPLANQWIHTYPQIKLVNAYGPTEAADDICQCVIDKPFPTEQFNVPIGKPLANLTLYILDRNLKYLPIGIAGEICVSGIGVGAGYWCNEEQTRAAFVTNPYSDNGRGDVLYRTGDLGRWLPDGTLEFLGRIDHQVKIRGFRIELGEIEKVLVQHHAVHEAVVIVWEEKPENRQLVGYLTPNSGQSANTSELHSYLNKKLPDHMVPSLFVWLTTLPLTPSGKVDRKSLPTPTEVNVGQDQTPDAPRDEIEGQLLPIWQNILQREQIGIFDNFFELGGHSLKAMQMVSRIHQTLGVKIALRDLFGLPTIAELAVQIKTAESSVFSGIGPAPIQADYDLSYAQQRLWLLHKMGGVANVAYNMPSAFLFEEKLDIVALKKAFVTLVERHEALRTAFFEIEGEPKQKIYPHVDFAINEIDISNEANVDEKAQQLVDKDANTAFDLSKPPLFRATLITLGENRYVFILTIHHIIGDGWSENILYREVTTLYNAYHQGMPNPLKPMRIQYKDFAAWQNAKGFEREEKYWLNQLAEVPPLLRLPYDFPAIKEERDFRGDVQSLTLDVDMTQGLRKLAVQKQTTVSNVMLALFKLLLFQLTKQEDFCVGVSIANRNHPDIENLIGFFINILPIRAQFSENMEFEELLQQVIQNTQEAFEHQDYPFDLMIQKLNPTRVTNRQPLLNVIYAFQNFLDVQIDIGVDKAVVEKVGGLNNPKGLDVSFKTSKFDLTLFVSDYEDTLQFDMEYDTGLFLSATIQRYLDILQRFAGMVAG